jgi:hypothetical protein
VVVVIALAALPCVVGLRSPGQDLLRLGDFADVVTATLDRNLNFVTLSPKVPASLRVSNLLDVIDPLDHQAVVDALHGVPFSTVRCRIRGSDTFLEVRLLGRVRRPVWLSGRHDPYLPAGVQRRCYRRFHVRFGIVANPEDDRTTTMSSTFVTADLTIREQNAADALILGTHPGDRVADVVAGCDHWKLQKTAQYALQRSATWHTVRVRTRCGQALQLSFRSLRGREDDGFLLRVLDVTDTHVAESVARFVADALPGAGDVRSRGELDGLLFTLIGVLAPELAARRTVGDDGTLRLDLEPTNGAVLDRRTLSALRTAEQLVSALTVGGEQDGSDLAFRREMAAALAERVLPGVVDMRLRLGEDPEATADYGEVLRTLRNVIQELRTSTWQHLLQSAISASAEVLRYTGAAVTIDVSVSSPPTNQEEALLLRMIAECYANVVKHADALHVSTSVSLERDVLVVRVENDGVCKTSVQGNGLGIQSLREDAELAGGSLSIAFAPAGTCRTELRLPQRALLRAA